MKTGGGDHDRPSAWIASRNNQSGERPRLPSFRRALLVVQQDERRAVACSGSDRSRARSRFANRRHHHEPSTPNFHLHSNGYRLRHLAAGQSWWPGCRREPGRHSSRSLYRRPFRHAPSNARRFPRIPERILTVLAIVADLNAMRTGRRGKGETGLRLRPVLETIPSAAPRSRSLSKTLRHRRKEMRSAKVKPNVPDIEISMVPMAATNRWPLTKTFPTLLGTYSQPFAIRPAASGAK